eukprot:TRINITY_DN3824_c0_g2_i1.p1 TRINITY_DN3824_c0_g2~~TRINITY_DN3824_c0_g2_i1.p1  ORF type:complete len:719 (-),score=196.26 TRINITY_DN3824_c0_g2_i1:85-2241(-)
MESVSGTSTVQDTKIPFNVRSGSFDLSDNGPKTYSQKEWTLLIHKVLVYLSQNNPPLSSGLYKCDRQKLPADFTDNPRGGHYCYPFKGQFLPSGALDGRVWKPSQGAKPTGTGLLKRYFYYKKDSIRIKRQVIWLIDREDWCFLDYRYMPGAAKSKISLSALQTPEGLNFPLLASLAGGVELPGDVYDRKRAPASQPPSARGTASQRKRADADADSDSDSDADDYPSYSSRNANPSYLYSSVPASAKYTPNRGLTLSGPTPTPPPPVVSAPPVASLPVFKEESPACLSTSPYSNQGFAYVDPVSFMPGFGLGDAPFGPAPSLFGSYDLLLGDGPTVTSGLLGDAPTTSAGLYEDLAGDSPLQPVDVSLPGGGFDLSSSSFASQYVDDSISGMDPIGTACVDDPPLLFPTDYKPAHAVPHFGSFSDRTPAAPAGTPDAVVVSAAKKRKADVSTVFPQVSALSLADPTPPAPPMLSMPNFFVAPMEYIISTVAEHMCKQLMFKRHVFLRTGIDADALLEKVKLQRVAVDLREFPGRMMTGFFTWLFEYVCRIRSDMLPPIYCLVCGKCNGMPHDEKRHAEFFGRLDPTFVHALRTRVRNVYELGNQFMCFLLRNPQQHQSFRKDFIESLHCPFCSGQNGEHSEEMHQHWLDVLHIEALESISEPLEPPRPAGNLEHYTKATFEWMLGQVPFSIPPFLLRLQRIQSFMECLVSLWRTVRLT